MTDGRNGSDLDDVLKIGYGLCRLSLNETYPGFDQLRIQILRVIFQRLIGDFIRLVVVFLIEVQAGQPPSRDSILRVVRNGFLQYFDALSRFAYPCIEICKDDSLSRVLRMRLCDLQKARDSWTAVELGLSAAAALNSCSASSARCD